MWKTNDGSERDGKFGNDHYDGYGQTWCQELGEVVRDTPWSILFGLHIAMVALLISIMVIAQFDGSVMDK